LRKAAAEIQALILYAIHLAAASRTANTHAKNIFFGFKISLRFPMYIFRLDFSQECFSEIISEFSGLCIFFLQKPGSLL
jgi:hypothetical protein